MNNDTIVEVLEKFAENASKTASEQRAHAKDEYDYWMLYGYAQAMDVVTGIIRMSLSRR